MIVSITLLERVFGKTHLELSNWILLYFQTFEVYGISKTRAFSVVFLVMHTFYFLYDVLLGYVYETPHISIMEQVWRLDFEWLAQCCRFPSGTFVLLNDAKQKMHTNCSPKWGLSLLLLLPLGPQTVEAYLLQGNEGPKSPASIYYILYYTQTWWN